MATPVLELMYDVTIIKCRVVKQTIFMF